jgi:ribonucleotide monophosphatase NagD (HAD superfamily)
VVSQPEEAEFILMHGTEALALPGGQGVQAASLEQLTQLLQRCARLGRALPLVVANPDLATVDGGALVTMPGTLAKSYKGGRGLLGSAAAACAGGALGGPHWAAAAGTGAGSRAAVRARSWSPAPAEAGGEVHLMGKPAAIIYREAARLLGLQPGELLAIGDSLEHDVAGAESIGADTVFVVGGIHAADVGLDAAAGTWDGERLRQLAGSYGVSPTYAVAFMVR